MAKLATANVMTGNLEEARALVDKVPSTLLHGIVALYGGDWSEAKSTLESGLERARSLPARKNAGRSDVLLRTSASYQWRECARDRNA